MTEYVGPAVAALVGAGQCALIWYGIRAMVRANELRADAERVRAAQEDARAAREEARAAREDARHAEAMRALEALIERTGGTR